MTSEALAQLHTGSSKGGFFDFCCRYLTNTKLDHLSETRLVFDGPLEGFHVHIQVLSGHSDPLAASGGLWWPTGPALEGRLARTPVAAGPVLEKT